MGAERERTMTPTRLGDVLRVALARLPHAQQLADYALWAKWDAVVGPTLAAHAQPRRLRRGILLVAVDSSAWMLELQFLKQDLTQRLNAALGRRVVRDLFVVLGGDQREDEPR